MGDGVQFILVIRVYVFGDVISLSLNQDGEIARVRRCNIESLEMQNGPNSEPRPVFIYLLWPARLASPLFREKLTHASFPCTLLCSCAPSSIDTSISANKLRFHGRRLPVRKRSSPALNSTFR